MGGFDLSANYVCVQQKLKIKELFTVYQYMSK